MEQVVHLSVLGIRVFHLQHVTVEGRIFCFWFSREEFSVSGLLVYLKFHFTNIIILLEIFVQY